jgi:Ca2+-transporting ATPase
MEDNKKMNDASMDGLTSEQVIESREKHGQNLLTPPRRTSLWKLYLEKYNDPIIRILLVAAVISLILAFIENEFIETIGIFLAIFIATTVGFCFEIDASKKFNVLTALGEEEHVKVRRGGKVIEIPRKDIVVGDIVMIETGDEIPADGQLLSASDLQIDESSLTGEPLCEKFVDVSKGSPEDTYPVNRLYRSTMVMNGYGVMEVVAVGDSTEIGKVARSSTEVTSTKTPLDIQLTKLAKLISKVGSGIAIAAFAIFLVHDILTNTTVWGGSDYFKMAEVVLRYFMMAVTLIVMAVPEGLPMAVTLSLALNMRRMLKSNNLVRKLHACETMGAVTIICTDKTGTLTQNKMQVKEFMKADSFSLSSVYQAVSINSTAYLDEDKGIGNPTEVALLKWVESQGQDYLKLRESMPVSKQQPFSTETKYRAAVADNRWLFVKGAPEVVLNMCTIAAEERQRIEETLCRYQKAGMRTLALAMAESSDLKTEGLKFQAIFGIEDPVREDVPKAVKCCQDAGIEVKIVTGDNSATAAEIGRQIGIVPDNISEESCITGLEWAALNDDEAYKRASEIRVMSRARPSDKQRLVSMLQKKGEIVAVTGDGTNDAPALHYAHVGLSLGSGTSVAKEASDMTLLDDSFSSIVNAVMWGRSLYKNIQRFLFFQLVVNVTALLLVLGGSVIGTEMPLTVTQILWVNLIMDTFAAMALASLPPSREVMKEKPRKETDFIISKSIGHEILFYGIGFFLLMFVFLYYCEHQGRTGGVDIHELTLFFTTFVMLQFWNLFNAKTLGSHHSAFRYFYRDRGMILVLIMIFIGQWLIVTFGGKMFRTVPLSFTEWVGITAITSLVLWVGEIVRWIKRCRE